MKNIMHVLLTGIRIKNNTCRKGTSSNIGLLATGIETSACVTCF